MSDGNGYGYDIRAIATQNRVDWMLYPPRERAWIYVERTRGYWHTVCRRLTTNWEDARELFGEIILFRALLHSSTYDEGIHEHCFTTHMNRSLMFDLRRTVSRKLQRKRPKTFTLTQKKRVGNNLVVEQVNFEPFARPEEPIEYELKVTLHEALEALKQTDPFAHDIFIDHTLNNYGKKLLASKYRCSRYIVNEYLSYAQSFLAKKIGKP